MTRVASTIAFVAAVALSAAAWADMPMSPLYPSVPAKKSHPPSQQGGTAPAARNPAAAAPAAAAPAAAAPAAGAPAAAAPAASAAGRAIAAEKMAAKESRLGDAAETASAIDSAGIGHGSDNLNPARFAGSGTAQTTASGSARSAGASASATAGQSRPAPRRSAQVRRYAQPRYYLGGYYGSYGGYGSSRGSPYGPAPYSNSGN